MGGQATILGEDETLIPTMLVEMIEELGRKLIADAAQRDEAQSLCRNRRIRHCHSRHQFTGLQREGSRRGNRSPGSTILFPERLRLGARAGSI